MPRPWSWSPERSVPAAALQRIAADLTPQGRPAHRWMDHPPRAHRALRRPPLGPPPLRPPELFALGLPHPLSPGALAAATPDLTSGSWLARPRRISRPSAALAGLRHDNPGWAFPQVARREGTAFRAQALGHPLLPEPAAGRQRRRRRAPWHLPPGHRLEHVGQEHAAALDRGQRRARPGGRAGLRGGARGCRRSPSPPASWSRTRSPSGVSFFMAELKRIRGRGGRADRAREAEGRTLLYLLDEVLRGTNSHGAAGGGAAGAPPPPATGAIGAVSTHDLQLAEIPELAEAARARPLPRDAPPRGRSAHDLRLRDAAGRGHDDQRPPPHGAGGAQAGVKSCLWVAIHHWFPTGSCTPPTRSP